MATITELMRSNLGEVFDERDAARRKAAAARIYAPDVVFSDSEGTVRGREALDAKAQAVLDSSPGLVFRPVGDVRVVRDLGYLAWSLGPEGGPPVVRGADVALVEGGLIARLYTVLLTSGPGCG